MYLTVNGKVQLGANEMFRIDDLEAGKTGLAMIQAPFALVPKLEDANAIVKAMNVMSDKENEDTKE